MHTLDINMIQTSIVYKFKLCKHKKYHILVLYFFKDIQFHNIVRLKGVGHRCEN